MNSVKLEITLGDAADIHYMIEKESASVELELEQTLSHNEVPEERITMLKNRIESFKKLKKKFDR